MCFSPSSSFIASSVLSLVGIAALKRTKERALKFLSALPFVFALQQFLEGFVWLQIESKATSVSSWMVWLFLFIAQVFWPLWIPLSFYIPEKMAVQKSILKYLVFVGFLSATINAYSLIFFIPNATAGNHHIQYSFSNTTKMELLGHLFYLFATILSPFVSTLRNASLIGLLLFLSFASSYLFFNEYFVSVWCFFAAMISVLIYFMDSKKRVVSPTN